MIVDTIKRAMGIRGMKQIELATKIGVTPSSINLFLSGKIGLKQYNIEKAFEVLGIELTITNNVN